MRLRYEDKPTNTVYEMIAVYSNCYKINKCCVGEIKSLFNAKDGVTSLHHCALKMRCANTTTNFDACVTVHHCYYKINSQLDATITHLSDNYNQLNMFRAIISPILRSTRLCLQLVV